MQTTDNCSECGSKILLDPSLLTNTLNNIDFMCKDCSFQIIKLLEFKVNENTSRIQAYESLRNDSEPIKTDASLDEWKTGSLNTVQEAYVIKIV
jgi:DNA-directed RNA polymerase subunit RPC12/RpoP